MGAGRRWTQAEIDILKESQGVSAKELARQLGRSLKSVEAGRVRYDAPYYEDDGDRPAEIREPQLPPVTFPDHKKPEDINWREYLDEWDKALDLMRRADPYQETLTIDMSLTESPVAVVAAADLHLGGGYTDHKEIRRTIELVEATPNMFIGLTGDTIEGFLPGVKPAETVEQQPSSVKSQLFAAQSLTKELTDADKLLWWSWGDHDAKWFEERIGINLVKLLVQDRVPYFVGRGFATLKLADQDYYLLINHRERFRSQWSQTHAARRAYEQFFPADVTIAAHTHRPEWRVFYHYEMLRAAGLNAGGKAILVQCGTFKTGPDPYTIRSWSRGIIGVPTLVFYPDRHDVDIFENPEKAARWLEAVCSP